MPELPEVMRSSEELNQTLSGMYILETHVGKNAKGARLDKIPSKTLILGVDNYAKRIIFKLHHPEMGEFHMVSFLGMEGHWGYNPHVPHCHLQFSLGKISSPPRRTRSSSASQSERRERSVITISSLILCFADSRRFGQNVVCFDQEQYDKMFKSIGLDLIKDQAKVTSEWWKEQFRNKRRQNRKVAPFLLEQKYFAGIGNYLKSEILYRARIWPGRLLKDLTDDEIERLRVCTFDLIRESYESGGLTISSFQTPNGHSGKFKKVVYKQSHDPHGNPVIAEAFNISSPTAKTLPRYTYWVREVQT